MPADSDNDSGLEDEIISHDDDDDDIPHEVNLEKLAKGISTLDKSQHIRKPTRGSIPRSTATSKSVLLKDLLKTLKKGGQETKSAVELVSKATKQKKLDPPLDKRVVEKNQRKVGYNEVIEQLSQWESVITSNRAKEHRRFPLEQSTISKKPVEDYLSKFTISSELEKQLEALEPPKEEPEPEDEFPLTLEEIIERRREIARLRAKQSYKEAEARRRGKIKSKKFHRVQRKERVKQQLKEFEELQKTNPEEALQRLEQLEKTRAQERASLRHKSTGQWAKNKLIRAKYDKETRQELAEQLSISRSLTQKVNNDAESESEKEDENLPTNIDPANPWLANIGNPNENVGDFVSGYKKYWEIKNSEGKIENKPSVSLPVKSVASSSDSEDDAEKLATEIINLETSKDKVVKNKRKRKIKSASKKKAIVATTEWEVEEISQNGAKKSKISETSDSVMDMFDDLEQKLQDKITAKLQILRNETINESKVKSKDENKKKEYEVDLSFKKTAKRPIIDEELNETSRKDKRKAATESAIDLNINLEKVTNSQGAGKNPGEIDKIDPTNFTAPKPKHLPTSLPDVDLEEDYLDNHENKNRLTIAEAFEDDDIVAEFQEEKENEKNSDKPKLEEASMPGWGSWVTKTNVNKPRKTKRLILKLPKEVRKDDKKPDVIISENRSQVLKEHLVSELPFPFKKVSDFEATIRAPIGNTFIPQTAHKKLTKPAVITKTGIPIEPMDESVLIDRKKMKWRF